MTRCLNASGWPMKERGILYLEKFEKIFFIIFIITSIIGGIFLGTIMVSLENKADLNKLASFKPTLPTRLYDTKGRLISELFQHKRTLITLEEIPNPVIAAFLAVEDTNFYNHFGIDFGGILRAAWANIKAGRIVQGGSTLTQQLVKGLYTEGEKTFVRKFYEAILALQVEDEFSKDEILEIYFNQIYLGHGTYGLASAANFYFDKPVQELNIIEASILAALPKAPHTYSPFRSPHAARKKNRVILNRLADLGYISKENAEKFYKEFWDKYWKKIVTTPPTQTSFGQKYNRAPHYTEYIRQELVGLFGEKNVYSKGYQVYTTLDLDQQEIAEKLLLSAIKRQDPLARSSNYISVGSETLSKHVKMSSGKRKMIGKKETFEDKFRKKFKKTIADDLETLSLLLPARAQNDASVAFLGKTRDFQVDLKVEGAFLAMEPATGRLTAMIGGREFTPSNQFNRATQARRQPGSAFKPFIYGAALEDRAMHYATGFVDSPIVNVRPNGTVWAPGNYNDTFRGYIHAYNALAQSLNLVSVQIYDLVGPDVIIDFASRLINIPHSRFQPDPTLSLGTSELTPQELLLGYTILIHKGREIIPHGIIYVTDRDGNVIYDSEKQIFRILSYKRKMGKDQIIEEGISFIMRKMMTNVVNYGTANLVRQNYSGPAAGKTGTTQGWHDAWFCGSTPDLAAVVWIGLDNWKMSLGVDQTGGWIAAPLWGKFMGEVYRKRGANPAPFSERIPKGVRKSAVSAVNGKWLNSKCDPPEPAVGTFIPAPIRVGNQWKKVGGPVSDCSKVETRSFLDIMQEQNKISDEELNKKRGYNRLYRAD